MINYSLFVTHIMIVLVIENVIYKVFVLEKKIVLQNENWENYFLKVLVILMKNQNVNIRINVKEIEFVINLYVKEIQIVIIIK